MALSIHTNFSSLVTQTNLTKTNNALSSGTFELAISLNGDEPRIVDIHANEYSEAWNINTLRAAAIGVTEHEIAAPGLQTIQIWMVDAGVVLDNITVEITQNGGL